MQRKQGHHLDSLWWLIKGQNPLMCLTLQWNTMPGSLVREADSTTPKGHLFPLVYYISLLSVLQWGSVWYIHFPTQTLSLRRSNRKKGLLCRQSGYLWDCKSLLCARLKLHILNNRGAVHNVCLALVFQRHLTDPSSEACNSLMA